LKDFAIAVDRFSDFCGKFFGSVLAEALQRFQADLRSLQATRVETFSPARLVTLFERCFRAMQAQVHAIGRAGAPAHCATLPLFLANYLRLDIDSVFVSRVQALAMEEMGAEMRCLKSAVGSSGRFAGSSQQSKKPRLTLPATRGTLSPMPRLLGTVPCFRWAAQVAPCLNNVSCRKGRLHQWSPEDTADTSCRVAFAKWAKRKVA
jgi:hypothetical protein